MLCFSIRELSSKDRLSFRYNLMLPGRSKSATVIFCMFVLTFNTFRNFFLLWNFTMLLP